MKIGLAALCVLVDANIYNSSVKKLLLLLILPLLSTQGLSASCPDGSKPIKSVSADGTYFVYSCGGGNEQTSSSTANSKAKAVAGIDIENDPNICLLYTSPSPRDRG